MTCGHTRMKRSTKTEKRGLARYAAKPKRAANIGLLSAVYTAKLPHGEF